MPVDSCRAACALSIVILMTGCSSSPMSDPWPEPRPLGAEYQPYRPPPSPELVESARPLEEPAGRISLGDALAATLLASPDLAATAFEVRASEAEEIQSGLYPNPDLEFEIENFGGTGELGGTDASEMTLALGQLVELGGDRLARQRVARYQSEAAGWAYEIRRIDVLSRTAADFITLLAAERGLEIAQGREDLARRVDTAVGQRVEAGKVSPVERTKAEVELAQAQLDRERAAQRVAASRIRLAANWGSVEPRFEGLTGDLDQAPAPPSLDAMLAHVDRNPDLARWASEAARRQAEIELALARSVPDLTINAGVRYHDEIDETGAPCRRESSPWPAACVSAPRWPRRMPTWRRRSWPSGPRGTVSSPPPSWRLPPPRKPSGRGRSERSTCSMPSARSSARVASLLTR
jgi:cobalt-zinc-cadmium efflux system outer membrane protein